MRPAPDEVLLRRRLDRRPRSAHSIQRWPADWEGAIAWYPAWNEAAALLGGHRVSRALAQPGAYPNSAKRLVLIRRRPWRPATHWTASTDGLVSQPERATRRFDPATATLQAARPLRCAGGADTGDTCLSDAQINALKTINTATRFDFPGQR